MDISAAILAASIIFGVSYNDMKIGSDVYEILKAPIHAVSWSDSSYKVANLTTLPQDMEQTLQNKSDNSKIYSVRFPVGSAEPLDDNIKRLASVFPYSSKLSVKGYASPDGPAPIMQYDLAVSRMEKVRSTLEGIGFNVIGTGGEVCGRDKERSDCWRADVFLEVKP